MKPEELDDIIEGLQKNNLLTHNYLLTGYIGTAATLERVANIVDILKQNNPNFIYLCDPVMGDNGKFYVPQDSL
jgi:pyridoxine kinase